MFFFLNRVTVAVPCSLKEFRWVSPASEEDVLILDTPVFTPEFLVTLIGSRQTQQTFKWHLIGKIWIETGTILLQCHFRFRCNILGYQKINH